MTNCAHSRLPSSSTLLFPAPSNWARTTDKTRFFCNASGYFRHFLAIGQQRSFLRQTDSPQLLLSGTPDFWNCLSGEFWRFVGAGAMRVYIRVMNGQEPRCSPSSPSLRYHSMKVQCGSAPLLPIPLFISGVLLIAAIPVPQEARDELLSYLWNMCTL